MIVFICNNNVSRPNWCFYEADGEIRVVGGEWASLQQITLHYPTSVMLHAPPALQPLPLDQDHHPPPPPPPV